jgi:hypothetical protein
MSDLVNVREAGAWEGIDCTTVLRDILANGAPGLFFPPGDWVVNDLELARKDKPRITIKGAGAGATRISTSTPNAGIFLYTAPFAQETWIEVSSLEMCNGPAYPSNGQAGIAIAVRGPVGDEIGKGIYRDLWAKNWWSAIYLERHNDASVVDLTAEYCAHGLYAVDCGDLEADRVKTQNGPEWAIEIHGTSDGQATHRAEGARLVGCSSNGQRGGLLIQDYAFAHVSASSFSSTEWGGLVLDGVLESSVTGGEWQAGQNAAAIRLTDTCVRNRLVGVFAYDSGRGVDLAGRNHSVLGLHATGNTGEDVTLQAADSVLMGGQLLSTGAAHSLIELSPARNNQIAKLCNARGIQLLANSGSTQS